MFSFTKEQKIVDISGIRLGGQPGVNPTVLFGGFFFKGNPVIERIFIDMRSPLFSLSFF